MESSLSHKKGRAVHFEKELKVIAVVGNPNTGKSTLFNHLCGTRQKVGNYPGVTVESKTGRLLLPTGLAKIIDLPGIYSLKAISPDEEVSADAIMGRIETQKKPDLILFVMDATNIKRNLYLYSQVAELKVPMVVVLTMTDLLDAERIRLDIEKLEQMLGVPVISVVSGNRETLDDLRNGLARALENPTISHALVRYPSDLEALTDRLHEILNRTVPISRFEARNLLFFKNDPVNHFFLDDPATMEQLASLREETYNAGFHTPSILSVERYREIDRIIDSVEAREKTDRVTTSEKIDGVLTSRGLGLLFFATIMYGMFQLIYSWARPVMERTIWAFDRLSFHAGGFFQDTPVLQSLLVDGVISGVGSVIVFLPQIIFLFVFVAILEDSGYMARAAFLMDKLLSWTGLNGRAFIPMLSGFACGVPAVLSTRVMPDAKSRITTIMILPLMSCSARLPIYLLFIGAIIEPRYGAGIAAFSLFAMHMIGPILALPIAFIFNRAILKTRSIPFLLEMPPYRIPSPLNVFMRAYEAASRFVVRAGTIIFAMSILIWVMSYFPRPESVAYEVKQKYETVTENPPSSEATAAEIEREINATYLEQSYLGQFGRWMAPLFSPLGFDWKISIGILSAFPAREVLISTLGILYRTDHTRTGASEGLAKTLLKQKREDGSLLFSPLLAITLMVFFALCSQCMSTLATVQRELGSWSWTVLQFSYMTVLAYACALLIYQTGSALGFA